MYIYMQRGRKREPVETQLMVVFVVGGGGGGGATPPFANCGPKLENGSGRSLT